MAQSDRNCNVSCRLQPTVIDENPSVQESEIKRPSRARPVTPKRPILGHLFLEGVGAVNYQKFHFSLKAHNYSTS